MGNPNIKNYGFKPGKSGNPSGKPKQLLTKDKVSSILGKFATMTRDQLQAVVSDSKSTMIEIMIASVMVRAAKDGDYARLDFLLSRSVGKVKEEIAQTLSLDRHEELDEIPRDKLLTLLAGNE